MTYLRGQYYPTYTDRAESSIVVLYFTVLYITTAIVVFYFTVLYITTAIAVFNFTVLYITIAKYESSDLRRGNNCRNLIVICWYSIFISWTPRTHLS